MSKYGVRRMEIKPLWIVAMLCAVLQAILVIIPTILCLKIVGSVISLVMATILYFALRKRKKGPRMSIGGVPLGSKANEWSDRK